MLLEREKNFVIATAAYQAHEETKFSSSESKKTSSPGVSPCHMCVRSLLQDISCLQVCGSVS